MPRKRKRLDWLYFMQYNSVGHHEARYDRGRIKGEARMEKIDYKQLLIDELEELSERDLEKIYKIVSLLRCEFIEVDDVDDEARYCTESWIEAEREATEAYKRGDFKVYHSVDEMMDDILAETDDE
jgi:homogentisate 1,2-dioxygenase